LIELEAVRNREKTVGRQATEDFEISTTSLLHMKVGARLPMNAATFIA
jgi:hypothetical protein